MTLARLLETGSGRMAARLVIEGLGVELVSDPGMERSPEMAGALERVGDAADLWPGPPSWTPDVGALASSSFRDPRGGATAWRLRDPSSGSALGAITDAVSYATGHDLWVSCWVRRDPASLSFVTLALHAGSSSHGVHLHLGTGATSTASGTVTHLAVALHDAPIGSGHADWWHVSFRCPGDGSATAAWLRVTPAAGLAASFPTTSTAAAGGVVIFGPRIADVDVDVGKANPLLSLGRERVYCFDLQGESAIGLVIDESVNIPEAVLDTPGTSIRLNEREDEALSRAFGWSPDVERWIDATVDVADITVTTMDATGIVAGDVVHRGTEAMRVTGIAGAALEVERGHWDSVPQKHWSNDGDVPAATLHNRPMRVRGRRVYLHLYGDADDLQGDGTQVWIGHVSGEPVCDDAGTVWRLQLASIAERLKGSLGGELAMPTAAHGIYYSWQAPLSIIVSEGSTTRINTRLATHFTGAYQTQQDFCDAFNAWLATAWLSTPTHEYSAVVTDDGGWTIAVTIANPAVPIRLRMWSPLDGGIRGGTGDGSYTGQFESRDGSIFEPAAGATGYARRDVFGDAPEGAGMVPRGFFGRLPDAARHADGLNAASSMALHAPSNRIYVRVPSDADAVQIEWPHGETIDYTITARDDSAGWIELDHESAGLGLGGPGGPPLGTFHGAVPVRVHRTLAIGTLEDLRQSLVANGPEYCNRVGNPFLTSADLASWADVVNDVASGHSWLASRLYRLSSSMDLEDLLQHEMRLYGLFPIVDSAGKVGVQSIERVTSGGDATPIDDELITAGWSSMQRGEQTVNFVEVKTGYDPREDEWLGGSIFVQDMRSYALDHEERTLEIEPRSIALNSYAGGEALPAEDVADRIRHVTDIFGHPHNFVTVNLPWSFFHLRIGDAVSFSADHLPDYRTGVRPMTEVRGIVVSRRWSLGEAHGALRLLVHGLHVSGYSPTARVLSHEETGDDQWSLIVDPALYAPAGAATDELFAVGDKIRLIQYDSETPWIATGTVYFVDTVAHEIGVNLDEAWKVDAGTWELCFQPFNVATATQQTYAAIAVDGVLDTSNARIFAP